MDNQKKRLEELRAKETLTNEELEELVRLSPKGSFKLLPNAFLLGIKDLEKSQQNAIVANTKMKNALEKEFYLEVISLGLQKLDFWLRMFWVARNKKGKIFSTNDKRTFGRILNDCKELGFDQKLSNELIELNDIRADGIHKFLLGEIDYDSLKGVSEGITKTVKKVSQYVSNQIGISLK